MKKNNSVWESIFDVVNHLILFLFAFLCIYPFYFVLIGSVSSGPAARTAFFWPANFTLGTYEQLLANADIYRAFMVSVGRTVFGTALTVFFTAMLAHLLTKQKMYFRKAIYRYFIVTMYFNAGLIPWYLTMQAYGLQNTFLLYIIPGTVNVFFLILVKTYIESIPASLEESAEIDGAGFFTIFLRIILPLTKPVLATIVIFGAVGAWNSWVDNFFLVSDRRLMTLQLMLWNHLQQAQSLATTMRNATNASGAPMAFPISPDNIRMAMVIITVFPIMLVYPFLQKYFAKGIMLGAVKG